MPNCKSFLVTEAGRKHVRRRLGELHQGGLVLARQYTGSPGTCNPEESGLTGLPMSCFPTLFSGSDPVGLPPVPWTEQTIEISPFFVRRRGHFLPRRPGWTDKLLNFFEWLVKVKATG